MPAGHPYILQPYSNRIRRSRKPEEHLMRVSVITVNYGRWELTGRCVRSVELSKDADVRITVVDNASPGPVPEWIEAHSGLRLLKLRENRGFAGGSNAGFEAALEDGADYAFFLNNDAEVLPDTVRGLADYLESSERTGIAAPAVYRASDPEILWSAGADLRRWKMRYEQVDVPEELRLHGGGMEVDFVSGCAMMVRTGLFRSTGGFRDDFFMYYEDADLCRKVSESGFGIAVVPSLKVLHRVASTGGGERSRLAVYFSERNRIVLSRDVLPPLTRSAFMVYKSAVLLAYTLKFLLRQGPGLVPWVWRGYIDGIAGRTGYREIMKALSR